MPNTPSQTLQKITLNNHITTTNNLFITIINHQTNKHQYIPQTITQNITTIITKTKNKTTNNKIHKIHNIPIIYLNQLNKHLSTLTNHFYHKPSNNLHLINITNTNNKTTTTQLLTQ